MGSGLLCYSEKGFQRGVKSKLIPISFHLSQYLLNSFAQMACSQICWQIEECTALELYLFIPYF